MKNKVKKIDVRLDTDCYERLEYIIEVLGAKRSSWVRALFVERVEELMETMNITQGEVDDYIKEKETKR